MSKRALLDLLPDFGNTAEVECFEAPAIQAEPMSLVMEEPLPGIDVGAVVAEEVSKAEAAITERLTATYEAILQAERDGHAAELDELRRELGGAAAATIESRFAAMEKELLELTTTVTARILGGVLSDELQKRSISALSKRVSEAIRDGEAVRIRAAGPQSLCEALAEALGEHATSVEFAERTSFDLTVSIDSSIYETRLAEWSAELAGVLE